MFTYDKDARVYVFGQFFVNKLLLEEGELLGLHDYRMTGMSPSMGDVKKAGVYYSNYLNLTQSLSEAICNGKLPVTVSGRDDDTFLSVEQAAVGRTISLIRLTGESGCGGNSSVVRKIRENVENVKSILCAGVRNYSADEYQYMTMNDVKALFMDQWRSGHSGTYITDGLQRFTPENNVFVSIDTSAGVFDTGNYMPGGFEWHEILLWLQLISQHKNIVGMNLSGIGGSGKDGCIAAHLLFYMISYMLASEKNA